VPKHAAAKFIQLGQERGKLRTGELVSIVVKSKLDRLLASR
jgi:hypothetical protein